MSSEPEPAVAERRRSRQKEQEWTDAAIPDGGFLGARIRLPAAIDESDRSFSMAACLNALKAEIRELESAFPPGHARLQIASASVDELTCRFVDGQGRKHVIHANVTVSPVRGAYNL